MSRAAHPPCCSGSSPATASDPSRLARRKSWPTSLHLGEHVCALHDSVADLMQITEAYISAALASSARIILIMSSEATVTELRNKHADFEGLTVAELSAHLIESGLPVAELLATRQLIFMDDAEVYLEGGCFEPQRMRNNFLIATCTALSDGWAGLYALGNMAWARTQTSGVELLHQYELSVNSLMDECKHFVGLCLYDRSIFSPGELCKVLQTHPRAAVGNEYFARNFYYNPPNDQHGADRKRTRLENWLANLRERKHLDKQLEDRTIELHLKNIELQQELNKKAKLEHEKHLAELASEQKSLFVSTLSHEIRTPLHGIMTAAMLLNSMDLGAEAQEYTKLVQVSSMHLQSVVNDVLSMSLLETGKVTVETERFNLRDAVQMTMKLVTLGDAALGKRFSLTLNDLPSEEVEGDRKKLTQVLLNLVSNSSKFTGDDGVVSVTAHLLQPDDGRAVAEFCITDNGIGIPPEKLAHVCRPFYQVDQGNTRKFSGLGLGLSVCKSLIEVLKGSFAIESDGWGKGTRCTFTFPFARPAAGCPASDALRAATLPPRHAVSSTIDVLLVEDNRLNAAITTRLLHRLGIKRVTTVEDGLSAVEATREGNFDLVLMDLHMPGKLDGFEAARLIRIVMATRIRRARVVALTANVSTEVRQQCEREMDGYIAKPLNLAQLVAALRAVDIHAPQTSNSVAS